MSEPLSVKENINSHASKKSFWKSKIEEWRQSGLSQPQFCKKQGLKYSSFRYWQAEERKSVPARFVKIDAQNLKDSSKIPAIIQIKLLSGLTIQLPSTIGISEIVALIRALEGPYA